MPEICCIVGCNSRRTSDVRMFRIPASNRKRAAWIRAISRRQWLPKKWHRICQRHFVSGEPSDDPEDIDYRPTLFMRGQDENSVLTKRQERPTKHVHDAHRRELSEVITY